ncbi:chloroplast import apparatus 2 [Euphorbia peplus]|nr:chloroplast import apparatus 2 [Euphorbia peplus]
MSSPYLRHSCGFDLDIVKSPSTSTRTSNTSSSTLSESSNSPRALSTRKPRTPRKRPNQTYNEAAHLLSNAYPNIFPVKNLSHPCKFTKPHHHLDESSSELLWPFRVFEEDNGFPLHHQVQSEKPNFSNEVKVSNFMNSDKGDSNSVGNSSEICGYDEDFDAESILDEEIQEGIDSIMGNLSVSNENTDELKFQFNGRFQGFGNGIKKGVRAFRQGNEANWWCFPIVDMLQISPRLSSNVPNSNPKPKPLPKIKIKSMSAVAAAATAAAKSNSGEKKKTKVEKPAVVAVELKNLEDSGAEPGGGLMLKLNYDGILNAWSDRGSPFSEESSGSESANDVSARLAQIDLFTENGGIREASVLRYKEKRRTRLFSKKIRYEVRKVNADQRPRMKGRFVRRPHSSASSQRRKEAED